MSTHHTSTPKNWLGTLSLTALVLGPLALIGWISAHDVSPQCPTPAVVELYRLAGRTELAATTPCQQAATKQVTVLLIGGVAAIGLAEIIVLIRDRRRDRHMRIDRVKLAAHRRELQAAVASTRDIPLAPIPQRSPRLAA